ncbi:pirin family protein [Achromobacter sp. 79A6]|jgi:redox-sensitive bicupin YhaK (pirin superfamily)|uniref:pirin family protein n=1 Tax=unclassified Achromobacter TaxID=2626865 RepID=UPI0021F225D0
MHTETHLRAVHRVDDPSIHQGINELHCARRLIAPGDWAFNDPFLLMAEDWFPKGVFDTHPHRGMETVTFVLEGHLEHVDNHGNGGVIQPGDAQWMTAGRGILHNEVPVAKETVHLLQLWVNLPAADKMVPPRYQDLIGNDMPSRRLDGVEIRVFSGASGSTVAPTLNYAKVTVLDIRMQADRQHEEQVPADYNVFLYVLEGDGTVGPDRHPVKAGQVVWMARPEAGGSSGILMRSGPGGMRVFFAGGLPLREPVVARGPFVMNTAEQVAQAYHDFRSGAFGA